MIENLKKVWKKELSKTELVDFVINMEEHSWIHEDQYVKAHMQDFLERLPRKILHEVFIEKMTLIVRSNGKYACAVTNYVQNVIIIFPEVYNLLTKTYDGWAQAVLAHEVGHIYLNHAEKTDDPMENQVDADTFACDMGYLEELESFLMEQRETVEKRVRLSFITSYYFEHYES